MKKLFAFYLLIIGIENAFAQAAILQDVYEDAREGGGEFFQNIISSLIVFFGLVWIISKIVENYSNTKKEREEKEIMDKIQNMENKKGFIAGHEYVDLGLSVKWATCNIGAEDPSDYGDYFAWGETSTKSSYTEENSKTYNKKMGNIASNPKYDAARANWGIPWRLPTDEEIDELRDKCEREWTTQGGHNGYKITGPNGNSIFLPAAGRCTGTSLLDAGDYGNYWSATPYVFDTYRAYDLYFSSECFYRCWYFRPYIGQSIRPVTE